MDAYERLLGDAMCGDPTPFSRQDYVEEAWRIVNLWSRIRRLSSTTNREHGARAKWNEMVALPAAAQSGRQPRRRRFWRDLPPDNHARNRCSISEGRRATRKTSGLQIRAR